MRSGDGVATPAPPAPGTIRVDGHERHDLNEGWRVASCEPEACAGPGETEGLDWIPSAVPGTAAGALREAGRWDYGDELDFDARDWWFRTEFEASPAAPGEAVLLRLDGVATVHEIFLNGEPIAAGDSMFASTKIDVGAVLHEGSNELAIRCRALLPLLGMRRKPRARWRTRLADNRLRFHRTMLLGRCPGFAPGPAAVGPWRPVWIERRRVLAVSGLEVRTRCEGEDGVLAVAATVCGMGGFKISTADVVIGGPGEAETALTVVPGAEGAAELRGEVRVPGALRWWPHTHGEPALHSVRLRVAGSDGEVGIDAGRVGFRELRAGPDLDHEVLRDGIDLHLNGVRVFARGAVWTPDDFIGMAPDHERLRAALERVRDAGMNMLRVVGTAAYESREFYDLCDELGILVWQDFMFANLDYPLADEGFRATVEAEADEALALIAGRPSLAVVCGNSEVEQQVAMLGLDPEIGRGELFGELLPDALERSDADAVYVPSAPCGEDRPFRPDSGVANYFGVGGYRRPLSDARLAGVKFAAECLAFANVPDEAGTGAILPGAPADVVVHHPRWKAGVPRDAGTGWDFDDVRDHYLHELFQVDPVELRRYDHERYLELSRAVSGEMMKAVFGEWRRVGSPCGGGLVLWLRDLVPGAGWGLVDHAGEPKAALAALAGVLAPVAVWMTDEGLAGVVVHVANDRPEPMRAILRIGLYADSGHPVGEGREEVVIGPHGSVSQDLETIVGGFADVSWAYRFGPPAQTSIVATLETEESATEPLAQAVFFPVGPPVRVESPTALGLRAEVRPDSGGLALGLRAERVVYGLAVEGPSTRLAHRWVCLEPGVERHLRLATLGHESNVGSIRVTASNLDGRLSVGVGPRDGDG
jgi:beta-mannosidase